jgi:hypothetical protein
VKSIRALARKRSSSQLGHSIFIICSPEVEKGTREMKKKPELIPQQLLSTPQGESRW